MPEAKEWIEAIKREDPPQLWEDVQHRAETGSFKADRSPRRPVFTALVLIAALAVIGSVLYGLSGLGGGTGTATLGPGEIVRYRLDGPPQPIAVGEGAAWVHIGAGDGTRAGLVRVDARTGEQRLVETPGGAWPAVGAGSAWLLCNAPGCDGGSVLQLDPATGEVIRTVPLPGRGGQIAGTSSGVWVTNEAGVSFVDPRGVVVRTFDGSYNLVGTDGTSLWVSGRSGGAVALDPLDGHEIAHVSFADVCTMEVADDMVWIASCDGGTHEGNDGDELMGIDASSGEVLFRETIDGYGQMRYAEGVLWLAQNDPSDGERIRILSYDPRTGARLADPIEITKGSPQPGGGHSGPFFGGSHVFFAVGEGSLWLTDLSGFEVIRVGLPDLSSSVPATVGSLVPEGNLVFASQVGIYVQFFRASLPGGDPAAISEPLSSSGLELSPDGTKLAYALDLGPERGELFVMDLDTGKTRRIVHDVGTVIAPSWHPDGKSIVLHQSCDLQREGRRRGPECCGPSTRRGGLRRLVSSRNPTCILERGRGRVCPGCGDRSVDIDLGSPRRIRPAAELVA
jgi:putative pyrroloquinoline-quinone binding quinoprotein